MARRFHENPINRYLINSPMLTAMKKGCAGASSWPGVVRIANLQAREQFAYIKP